MEIKTLTLENDVTLAYREYGTGDKYLLSTQNFFFEDCHMALMGQPPYDYHVFLIYMRGYGQSTHIFDDTPKDYTALWGEDVLAFARAKGVDSFYYTGISHGNWAGWYIAFHHSEYLRGFACCDGVVQIMTGLPHHGLPVFDPDQLVGNREALDKVAWIENWPTENPQRLARREANHREHLEIMMNRKREEFLVHNTGMTACEAATQEELDEKLSALRFPLLLMGGSKDPLSRIETMAHICKLVPGSRMLAYQELGHGGLDECPEIAARDIDRFFTDMEGYIV